MASLGLRKMLFLIISNNLGVWMLLCPDFLDTVVNGKHIAMAVVISIFCIGRCYALNCLTDVLATIILLFCGRWKATVAYVSATIMLCYGHMC